LVVGAALIAATGSSALANPDAFRAAVELETSGDFERAAAAFVALAQKAPDDDFADDALMKAARLYEERLSVPARAVELYQRVIDDYPQSRLGRRAQTRVAVLRERIGPGAAHADAASEFQRIQREYPDRDPLESIADMNELIADHPDYPGRGEALLWTGSAYERHGWLTEAERAYGQAAREFTGTRLGRNALKSQGDVLLARGDFDGAEAAYRALVDAPDYAVAAAAALESVEVERGRARLLDIARVGLAAFVAAMLLAIRRAAGTWPAAARALVRPPAELLYLAPIVGLLVLSSISINELVGNAVMIIALGSLVITWLSGVALDLHRERGPIGGGRVLGQAVASAAAVLALIYIAVKRERVLDMIIETWRNGPDPG